MSREELRPCHRRTLLHSPGFRRGARRHRTVAIAHFWTGRCYRRMGHYDDALKYTERGETLALACGYPQMAAIMQATRSWLAFQKGKLHEAMGLLRRAEEALNQTDDFLNRGNIQSAYGRIARRQGQYERARQCFERAIAEYRTGGHGELQLARTLLNLAFVERLLALQAQRDSIWWLLPGAAGQRDPPVSHPPGADSAQQIELLRNQARGHLEEAFTIYHQRGNQHGIAGVHINRGYLHLDAGDLEARHPRLPRLYPRQRKIRLHRDGARPHSTMHRRECRHRRAGRRPGAPP